MIEAACASPRYLPPYSPDYNPIENAFARLKALLRRAAERSVNGHWNAIGQASTIHPNRIPELLLRRRICCNKIGDRSEAPLTGSLVAPSSI
jgi:transposase